jgi:hypothetical protein
MLQRTELIWAKEKAMGAELWFHEAPWKPQPEDALFELQVQFLREHYDLASLLRDHLHSAREAVRLTEAEGDPYEILGFHQDCLACLEELASRPIPEAARDQIEFVREIEKWSGEGVGNILDVTGVSGDGSMDARVLTPDDVRKFCGTDHPTRPQAVAAVYGINEKLDRGESACFPFFDAEGNPIGWYFVGNTID